MKKDLFKNGVSLHFKKMLLSPFALAVIILNSNGLIANSYKKKHNSHESKAN